jgi:hypothetical protein
VPAASRAVAVSCCEAPTTSDADAGVTLTLAIVVPPDPPPPPPLPPPPDAARIVTTACPIRPADVVAFTNTVPSPIAVNRPALDTLPLLASFTDHVTPVAGPIAEPSERTAVAVKSTLAPTVTDGAAGETAIPAVWSGCVDATGTLAPPPPLHAIAVATRKAETVERATRCGRSSGFGIQGGRGRKVPPTLARSALRSVIEPLSGCYG